MPISQIVTNSIAPSQTLTTPIIATTMGVGGATPANSGSGITFPATQSPSSEANTLDDYEEGTWTPTISALTNCTVTNKASATNRRYTKVGNVVTINIGFDYTSSGGVPSFSFTLPFAPQTDYGLSGFGFGYPNVIRWAVRSNSGVTINAYGDVASTSAADINISLSYQV